MTGEKQQEKWKAGRKAGRWKGKASRQSYTSAGKKIDKEIERQEGGEYGRV